VFHRLGAFIIAVGLIPSAVTGQEADPSVTVGEVYRQEGELRFSIETTGLFDAEAQRTIRQGGTAAIDYTVELYRRRAGWFDSHISTLPIPFRVSFDTFDRKYRLLGSDIRLKTESFDEIVTQCTMLEGVLMGSMDELGLDMNATYYFVVRVSYQPMSVETIDELRNWMSKPGDQAAAREQGGSSSTGVGTRIARALMSAAGYGEEELQGESERFRPVDLPER
jgi:hypothetical protein